MNPSDLASCIASPPPVQGTQNAVELNLSWPVVIGSQWRSRSVPNSVWTLEMANSTGHHIRLVWRDFVWQSSAEKASDEFYSVLCPPTR